MGGTAQSLDSFLSAHPSIIRVVLTRVRGSSPRDAGTEMFVAAQGIWGTVGGGQLEYHAIAAARALLADGGLNAALDIPLGPEIGQCCGGRVEVQLTRMRSSDKKATRMHAAERDAALPHVYVMGAGHVGRALADQFQHLPVHCVLVDTRADEIALSSAAVETRISAIPEMDIQNAPRGSAFIVLTHDHGLDFLLTSSALDRGDAAYVGMIGSATKRAKLRGWMRENGDAQNEQHLICPIGASNSQDKRPSVIAAFVVAEVMGALTAATPASAQTGADAAPGTGHQIDPKGKTA